MTSFARELAARETAIEGLTIWALPVHGDERGLFKENWQRRAMTTAGLPDFGPVQHNIAVNEAAGVTRGIHAEPWDKFVSVAAGRVFGAWVDLRAGPGFGTVVTAEIDVATAVFVPRGVGNAYQTRQPGTVYSYLVNEHWSPDAPYVAVDPGDPALAIDWPIPLTEAVLSTKDRGNPPLAAITPIAPRRILVLGATGQVGRALAAEFAGDARLDIAGRAEIDLAAAEPGSAAGSHAAGSHAAGSGTAGSGTAGSREAGSESSGHTAFDSARNWPDYDVVINAAAYTAVDEAETAAGRRAAWATNVTGVAALARICTAHRLTLVHLSSDYIFDGTATRPYREDDPPCPLGVYGQTKAAAEAVVRQVPRHYLLRTSWVVGEGKNFVRTMAELAARGVDPAVVDDQIGRPTAAADLAAAIRHLLETRASYGTYQLTGAGQPASWHQVAREVFAAVGADPDRVRPVSTAQYLAGRAGPLAPRPAMSVLDLAKITATGFTPTDWRHALRAHLHRAGPGAEPAAGTS